MIAEHFFRAALVGAVLSTCLLGATVSEAAPRTVDFVVLDGVIDPVTSRFLLRELTNAARDGSHAVVIQLDTPGGLDVSMREIVERILNSEVPVVVWIAPSGARAASAGVFITYAAHVAAMAPGTNIGAAHPVGLGGDLDETSAKKVTNDAAAYLRSIAKQRGRDLEFAERAVRDSVSIDSQQALEQHVIDLIAAGPRELLEGLDGRTLRVGPTNREVKLETTRFNLVFHEMSLLERLLHSVVSPEAAFMLLVLGFYAIIFELYNPGIGAAGVLGGVSLILGFYALSVLPTSWAAVALIVLAVAFFLVDLHTAGLGVFTIGGSAALVAGGLLLFAGADPALRVAWWAIAGAVGGSLVFFISIMTAAMRARSAKPVSGAQGMVGTAGIARTDIAPEGRVMARGTLWNARTVGAAIGEGSEVRIIGVNGLTLMVEETPSVVAAFGNGAAGPHEEG